MHFSHYESKIIDTFVGPFATIHDYCRLDLDLVNKKFRYHNYYLTDGQFLSYHRTVGDVVQIIDEDNGIKKIILTATEISHIKSEKIFDDYYENLKEITCVKESKDWLDQMSHKFINLKKNKLVTEKISDDHSLTFYIINENEIKVDRYPFGIDGKFKKIRVYRI